MCGIAGYWERGAYRQSAEVLGRMVRALEHRGPDDQGDWRDHQAGVHLGHSRLSVVDLSAAGHQPMRSHSGRFTIVFNGEIYNHDEIRRELQRDWRGHSDTETLLAAIEEWGLRKALGRAHGMFALAMWDSQREVLSLARDRVGEKPLYYGHFTSTFVFASELKALEVHPAFRGDICTDGLELLLRYNYLPAPHSIYEGVSKLVPGTILEVGRGQESISTYWSASAVAESGLDNPVAVDFQTATDEFERRLMKAIGKQMIADVPLGAFLSGGIDSSTVVALMQAQSSTPVRTFSIGFREPGFDEAVYAKAVAQHLGTRHVELYVSPQAARDVIPTLSTIYDEPFADSSQIPTILVSRLARGHVTVALSGDGGDELFGGYNRHLITARLWPLLTRVPRFARMLARRGLTSISPQRWNDIAALFGRRNDAIGDKVYKAARALAAPTNEQLYMLFTDLWRDGSPVVRGSTGRSVLDGLEVPENASLVEAMMLLDLLTYLPDDILCKVDRAAMSVSLETRVPFLDHEVVEYAWRLPLEMKIHRGTSKRILREVLYRHVPRSLVERPKMGFGVPLASWLRGPLKDWAEDLLSRTRLEQEGLLDVDRVREKWKDHLSKRRNWHVELWGVLMFESWLAHRRG